MTIAPTFSSAVPCLGTYAKQAASAVEGAIKSITRDVAKPLAKPTSQVDRRLVARTGCVLIKDDKEDF